jgi:hypothetical protein
MKNILIICILVIFTSCAGYKGRNLKSSLILNNVSFDEIIDEFGFPDDEREVLEKKVFIWNKEGVVASPSGDDMVYSQGNCRIKVVVDDNKNVESATIEGMACRKIRKRINKKFKS